MSIIDKSDPVSAFAILKIWLFEIDPLTLGLITKDDTARNVISQKLRDDEKNLMVFADKFCHPSDKHILTEQVQLMREGQQQCWSGLFRIRQSESRFVWVYARIGMVENTLSNRCTYMVGMMADISTCINTELQLQKLITEVFRFRHRKKLEKLTKRELNIIKLITLGHSYTTIAGMLNIQPDTVNSHRKNVLRKLELNNIAMLTCFAKEAGII